MSSNQVKIEIIRRAGDFVPDFISDTPSRARYSVDADRAETRAGS